MAPPKAPRHAIEAAKADVAGGTSQPEAAARHGVKLRTLERALAESRRGMGAKPRPKATSKQRTTKRSAGGEADESSLTETLAAELRYARAQRRGAETDAQRRSWSKRIEDLVKVLERIAPPPPVPPDAVQAELRRLDGVTIGLIEQFLENPIKQEEVA